MISEIVSLVIVGLTPFSLMRPFQINFTGSAETHRTVVNPGVDDELDAMKRTYDGVEDLLNRTSQDIAATIPAIYSLDLNVIFFPQIGFLISVPLNPGTGRGDYEGGPGEQSWDRMFSSDTRVYYKDSRMRELDETLGDIWAVICGMLSLDYELTRVANHTYHGRQGDRDCPCARTASTRAGGDDEPGI